MSKPASGGAREATFVIAQWVELPRDSGGARLRYLRGWTLECSTVLVLLTYLTLTYDRFDCSVFVCYKRLSPLTYDRFTIIAGRSFGRIGHCSY